MRFGFAALATILSAGLVHTPAEARTTADLGPAALAGTVRSPQEGAMEGVLVTAQRDGSSIAVTVVTDDKGHFAFPAARLATGHYTLRTRAAGYTLDGSNAVDVMAGKASSADLALKKIADLTPQLTNAEWLNSIPGTEDQKRFLGNCVGCHTLNRILTSTYTADDFKRLILLMGTFAPGSVPGRPQMLGKGPRPNRLVTNPELVQHAAEYLASVNLSKGPRSYPLKALPRPTGRSTHVIVTTYRSSPRPEAEPHDVNVWPDDGSIWYSDFGSLYVGQLDPDTGKVIDYALPAIKPEGPKGALDMKLDPEGNMWVSTLYQGGMIKFDRKTKKAIAYPLPAEWQTPTTQVGGVAPEHMDVDGYVWTANQESHSIVRLHVADGKWENLGVLHDQNGDTLQNYDILSGPGNHLYAMDFGGTKVGKVDAKTGKMTTWKTVFAHSRPRRAHWGDDGKIWFAEFGGDGVGSFDPETGKIQEWRIPVEWTMPYDALRNKAGDIWTGSMLTDRVSRLNSTTGDFVDYLLPDSTNIRHVSFDEKHNTLWTSGVHTNIIVKLEALD